MPLHSALSWEMMEMTRRDSQHKHGASKGSNQYIEFCFSAPYPKLTHYTQLELVFILSL